MIAPHVCRLLLALLLLIGFNATAQKETANWYFGSNAGITFTSQPKKPVLVQSNGKLSALEGCASISDSLGNLLFYTDGIMVYNKNHQVMNNGTGLLGGSSASQSSVIVQHPYNLNIYYLFTVADLGQQNGLRYSVINTTAIGGQGSVLQKNMQIPGFTGRVAEKITAVDHRLTRDAWVIVHGSDASNDAFYAFRLTHDPGNPLGKILPPVISQIGVSHQFPISNAPNKNTIGCMKVSPDGTKLALAIQQKPVVEIYKFNDTTGVISDTITFRNIPQPYGIEFSPDSKKLYISSELQSVSFYQVNLMAGKSHPDSVKASLFMASPHSNIQAASLQLGLDDRIYIANPLDTALSVFAAPDSLFVPQLKKDAVGLNAGTLVSAPRKVSRQGLPNFNQSYFYKARFKARKFCIGDVTEFTLTDSARFKSVAWNFGDPGSGSANISTERNPVHQFSKADTFQVSVTALMLNNRTRTATKTIIIYALPEVSLKADREICPGDSIQIGFRSDIKAEVKVARYLWSTGQKTDSIYIKKAGIYWLDAYSAQGCVKRDSITITYKQGPAMFAEPTAGLCFGTQAIIRTSLNLPLRWFNGSGQKAVTVTEAGWYKLSAYYNDCWFTDSIEVVYKDCPELYMVPNLITQNNDGRNDNLLLRGVVPGSWSLQIFNRWGNLIYENESYRNEWPEKEITESTYYFRLIDKKSGFKRTGWVEVVK